MIAGKLARLGPRERAGLILAGVVMALVAIDWLVVQPVLRESRRLSEETAAADIALRIQRGKHAWVPSVTREYERACAALKRSGSPSETIAEVKGEVDELARKNNVMIFSMEHREPIVTEDHAEYFVAVGRFEADLTSFGDFLRDVQAAPGLLRVTSMSISRGETDRQVKGSLQLNKLMLTETR